MRILVTGAGGHIGKAYCQKYTEEHEIVPVSLRQTRISELDFSGVDAVLHLSTLVHQKETRPKQEYLRINTEQTLALARAAKESGVPHFVFFSTVAVYGQHGYLNPPALLIDENSACHPADAYAESKLLAEQGLAQMEDEDFTVSLIRPPVVYGKGAPGNMERLRKLVKSVPVLPFNYDNQRSLVGINNLIHFTNMVIEKRVNGVLIPQDAEVLSIQKLVEALAKHSGKRIVLFKLPAFVFRLLCWKKERLMSSLFGTLVFNSTRSNLRLGFAPPYSSDDELASMCA